MPDRNPQVAGLVLAAGSSSRLGRPKQLLKIDGIPMVLRAVRCACSSNCNRIFVVVGANRSPIVDAINDLDVEIVENRQWREGIGSSIRTAVERIEVDPCAYDAALVMLADQIRIRVEQLNRIIDTFRSKGSIVASNYENTLGVPALFPREYFHELRKLAGDTGAKSLLSRHQSQVIRVDCPEASADVDTAQDLVDAEAGLRGDRAGR